MDILKFTIDQSPTLNATSFDAQGDPENVGPYAWHIDPADQAHFIKDNGDSLGQDATGPSVKIKFLKTGPCNLNVVDGAGNQDGGVGNVQVTAGKPVSVKIAPAA